MTQLLLPEEAAEQGRGERSGSRALGTEGAWRLLGWMGFALAVIGSVDIFLTWFPFDFGNVEWEFGTVSQSFNGLPSLTIGLGLCLASAAVLRRNGIVRVVSGLLVLLAVGVVAAAILYATTVPIALNSVPENAIATGLKKAIAKTTTQAVLYPVVFMMVGIGGFRLAQRNH